MRLRSWTCLHPLEDPEGFLIAEVLYVESTSAQTLRNVEVMHGAALRSSPQPFRRPSPQEQCRHAFR
jgi:hypothetical protein